GGANPRAGPRDAGRSAPRAARSRGLRGAWGDVRAGGRVARAGRGLAQRQLGLARIVRGPGGFLAYHARPRCGSRRLVPEVGVGERGGLAAARRALAEALLDQEGLVDVLERAGLPAHHGLARAQAR